MVRRMHRTNLYLTEEQERALDERARAQRTSRAAVIREILDNELAARPVSAETDAALGLVADAYLEASAGLFDDDPDLRIER
jgi:hypothetical protein